jgi:hypothetical protein
MVVNCVIPSANLRGQGRLSRVTLHFGIFQHQRILTVAGEFRVDAAVVDEGIANGPRDHWNGRSNKNSFGPNRRRPLSGIESAAAVRSVDADDGGHPLPTEMPVCRGSSLARVRIGTLSVNNLRGVSALGTRIESKLWSAVFHLSRRPDSAMRPRFMEEDTIGSWRNAASRRALSSRASYFTDFDNRSRQPARSKLPKRFSSPAHRRSIIVPR